MFHIDIFFLKQLFTYITMILIICDYQYVKEVSDNVYRFVFNRSPYFFSPADWPVLRTFHKPIPLCKSA